MTEEELYTYVVKKAVLYGCKLKNNSETTNEKGNAILRHSMGNNDPKKELGVGGYFALIDKDQSENGKYQGLSFVVFPMIGKNGVNTEQTHFVVSIGIGSATLGEDTALACSPGLRRSFMKLTNCNGCNFFFAENWGDMELRTPGLKEALEDLGNKQLLESVNAYDDNASKNREGLLPAACLVDLDVAATKDKDGGVDSIPVIDAWLAQYAKWRLWDSSSDAREKIFNAISKARTPSISNKQQLEEVAYNLLGIAKSSDSCDMHANNRYIVLQGAPGCGKTRMALDIASKYFKADNVVFTQFHAETTYADFVYGIKPDLNGKELTYNGERGVLLDAIDKAKSCQNQGGRVLLIIDEINRAHLANVLGPVFYLFEANAQDHNYKLKLGKVGNENIELDKLPDNLYVIATMNTADRSLAVVDFALRRRFAWYTLYPKKLESGDLKEGYFFDEKRFDEFNDLFEKYATDDELHLQPGHSYFILRTELNDDKSPNAEMLYKLRYELMPLMKEYFNEGFMLPAKEDFCHLFYKYTKEYMYK